MTFDVSQYLSETSPMGIIGVAHTLVDDLLRFVFPPECIVCEKPLDESALYYCDTCRDLAADIDSPICPVCRNEIESVIKGCKICRGEAPISILWGCGGFDQFYRAVVHALKYEGLIPLASMMSEILFSRICDGSNCPPIDMIVPIPLHWTRRRKRGFNQSEKIAEALGGKLEVPVASKVLTRVKRTLDQTGLNAEQRRENMKGAFKVTAATEVAGNRILLIDDVTTTGATLNEAASELRRVGCKNVFAAVIAIASSN